MANIAAISGSQTSLAATTNMPPLTRTHFFQLTKPPAHALYIEPNKNLSIPSLLQVHSNATKSTAIIQQTAKPMLKSSATLLANMDIWSSAQGVYIFVGTNDISVVRCDAHTELPKWEFLSLVGPGKKKS